MRLPRISHVSPQLASKIALAACMTAAALFAGGCDTFGHLENGFLNPAEVGRFKKEPLLLPIVSTLDTGIEEPNDQFAQAQDVKSEDLVSNNQDYVIGRNDLLSVTITDLVAPGVETLKQLRVSESGNISLPLVGQVRAEGLTESQLEQAIQEAYRRANLMPNAQVSVSVQQALARTFSIIGSVQRPGQYQITQADFRVLDALVASGDISAQGVDYLYVVRRPENQTQPAGTTGPGAPAGGGMQPGTAPAGPGGAAPQPTDPLTPRSDATPLPSDVFAPKNVMFLVQDSTITPGATGASAPTAAPAPTANQPAAAGAPAAGSGEGHYVIVDGKPVLVGNQGASAQGTGLGATAQPAQATDPNGPIAQPAGGSRPTAAAPATPAAPAAPMAQPAAPAGGMAGGAPTTQPFEGFNGPSTGTNNRIIRVPVLQLKNGDLRYNIVVHPSDMIIVPLPVTGEYYVDGHVNRTGVYSLTARNITLKQAIAAAGGFDQLAIPATHTDIIRRIGTDREVFAAVDLDKVFAGQQPDIYLKPNDVVRVGTNAFAPFVSSFRNAFRITYGFGFLYDRNYAPQQSTNGH